jgi:hypothetical protein
MTDSLKPNQALFIWRRLTATTPEEREPAKSKATPKLEMKDFQPLVDRGFLTLESRGKSKHVVLTDKAWAWAEQTHPVVLQSARSPLAAKVLGDLLNCFIPFLAERQIALASVLAPRPSEDTEALEPRAPETLWHAIEKACLALTGQKRKERVLLARLRSNLGAIPRSSLDEALLLLQRQGKLVLYREDNSAALTPEDHAAALIVGDSPRHIVYLEN